MDYAHKRLNSQQALRRAGILFLLLIAIMVVGTPTQNKSSQSAQTITEENKVRLASAKAGEYLVDASTGHIYHVQKDTVILPYLSSSRPGHPEMLSEDISLILNHRLLLLGKGDLSYNAVASKYESDETFVP